VRKIKGSDAGTAYAMKVLKKATLKSSVLLYFYVDVFREVFSRLISDLMSKYCCNLYRYKRFLLLVLAVCRIIVAS